MFSLIKYIAFSLVFLLAECSKKELQLSSGNDALHLYENEDYYLEYSESRFFPKKNSKYDSEFSTGSVTLYPKNTGNKQALIYYFTARKGKVYEHELHWHEHYGHDETESDFQKSFNMELPPSAVRNIIIEVIEVYRARTGVGSLESGQPAK